MPWLGPTFRTAVTDDNIGIALTGVGSWLGQALLAMLVDEDLLPPPERLRLFGSSERVLRLGGRQVTVKRLAEAKPLFAGPWLILHFAFLGKERTADLSVSDFNAANDDILHNVLRITAPAEMPRMIFSSSGAVYRTGSNQNPYGSCKAEHERRLTEYCATRCIPLVMPRIFNIGGPFINKLDSYALSSFIRAARTRGAIRIETRRQTYRSYVHVNEMLGLVLETALAQKTGPPLAFDTAGQDIIEMGDLAKIVVQTLAMPDVTIERASCEDLPPDRYVGDGTRYRTLLATQGRTIAHLEDIIADTARDLEARSFSAGFVG